MVRCVDLSAVTAGAEGPRNAVPARTPWEVFLSGTKTFPNVEQLLALFQTKIQSALKAHSSYSPDKLSALKLQRNFEFLGNSTSCPYSNNRRQNMGEFFVVHVGLTHYRIACLLSAGSVSL